MKDVYLLNDAIISPLGFSTRENISAVQKGISGLKQHTYQALKSETFVTSLVEEEKLNSAFAAIGDPAAYTKLEKIMILAIDGVLQQSRGIDLHKTALIVSTTKGNIHLLEEKLPGISPNRVYLPKMAKVIAGFFGFTQTPIVISNACISGGHALAVASRFIKSGRFENAIVVGGDLTSNFVLAGFKSFNALSNSLCKPFSNSRDGINIGEGAAAVLVSSVRPAAGAAVKILGEAITNDANHISGPSRTGEGLFQSINSALTAADISAEKIDYISAHGTATLYNDEMEAIAINRAGLQDVPVNSFKGYYGHTLGAAALIESILTKHSLLEGNLYASLNFDEIGVSRPINVIEEITPKPIQYALKTASGFGGGNIALIFKKEQNEL